MLLRGRGHQDLQGFCHLSGLCAGNWTARNTSKGCESSEEISETELKSRRHAVTPAHAFGQRSTASMATFTKLSSRFAFDQ